ncbi:MAG: FecR domain-containing protein, partial [Pseudomonadota bacterium]
MSQAEPRVIDAIADAPIALPNDPALFTADYERAGDDLILATADGARTVVRSYFDADAPQDLVIGGAVVPGRVVGKLARVASADAGAEIGADLGLEPARPAAAPAEGAARPAADLVAEVTETDGRAFIQRADGAREPAVEGAKIYRDDTVITEAESAVGVTFVDGMSFSLSDEGRVLIDEFHYNPEAGEGGGLLSVLQGKFSFVSGGAAHTKPDALMIETPTMTIGVRGTKVVADVGQEGELSQIGLLAEEDGTVGKIAVFTDAGEQIVDVANQVVQVSSRFEPPSAPETRATSDIVETFADALDVLPAPEAFFEPRPEPPAPAAA